MSRLVVIDNIVLTPINMNFMQQSIVLHVLQHPHPYQVCHVIAPSVHINDSI